MRKLIKKFFSKKDNQFYKKSFSQEGEDMILNSLFEDMGFYKNGFYIDIGALHPFRFSNTAYFYNKGWHGINIEPTPNSIALFDKNRTRDINLNIGIGLKYDKLKFYSFFEPALNSFSEQLSYERNDNTNFKIKEILEVEIFPLADVLDKYITEDTTIDFMSVDAEGFDLQVLKSNNWDKYKPKFILTEEIIENIDTNNSEIYNLLKQNNYSLVARTQRTMIFKHN